jgi:hypothetical protein
MNKLITTSDIDIAPRVVFHTLKFGERFKHAPGGNIHQVFAKPLEGDYITVKRADGWLVRVDSGGYCWGKGVIKL